MDRPQERTLSEEPDASPGTAGLHPVPPAVPELLELVQTEGAAAWPTVSVERSDLERLGAQWWELEERRGGVPFDPSELYIAIGCACDARGAIAAFEQRYVSNAWPALRRHNLSGDEADELLQRVRERLFVNRREDVAVLLHCAGQGRIGGLVRVVLVREALRLRGTTSTASLAPEHFERPADDADAVDRAEHRALLKGAFERAAPRLDARSRSVLRLHYVRGVTTAQIAGVYGVHRGTAARWLATARDTLFRYVQRELFEAAPDLRRWTKVRLENLVLSRLDLSLSRLFAEP